MAELLVEMQDVSLGYTETPVLTDVNLEIRRGELVVIAGASGCGKSTMLKGAIGLLRPLAGRINLLGTDLEGLSEERLTALRSRIGLLFQGGALLNSMSVAANVALPIEQHARLPSGAVDKLVRMKLALVGLEEHGHKLPSELSGGMRKRAALARAMALDPDLLLCDEPSAGLDPVTAADLDRLLLGLREAMQITMMVVTHELSSIESIADRVVMMAGGTKAFDGSLDEVRSSKLPAVRDFFDRRATAPEAAGRSMLERIRAG